MPVTLKILTLGREVRHGDAMPTSNPQVKVTLTIKELERLRKQAKEGETDSNLIRRKLGLKPLKHGGKRESK